MLFYFILSYLIATWGVNQVINPLVYAGQLSAHTIAVPLESSKDYLRLTNNDAVHYPYLLFDISDSNQYFQRLSIRTADSDTFSAEFCKGMNCLDMRAYGDTILMLRSEIEKYGIAINSISASDKPYVDVHRTITLFISFTLFSLFWEMVQSIKKRYTR